MIAEILSDLFIPHLLAFFLLFRLAMIDVRPNAGDTMRENMVLLWRHFYPQWCRWLTHPLYWAMCAIVSAFFLSGALWGVL